VPLLDWASIWSFIDSHPILVLIIAFTLDSLGIPSVPEVAALVVFSSEPTFSWALTVLGIVVLVEVVAGWVLYAVVAQFGLPGWLRKLMVKYSNALLVSDERLLLVNRLFPILPFGAAFISVAGWNVRRAFTFVALGSFAKYALLLAFSGLAFTFLHSTTARLVTMGGVVMFIGASALVATLKRKNLVADPS
jgi:hypothetical protein